MVKVGTAGSVRQYNRTPVAAKMDEIRERIFRLMPDGTVRILAYEGPSMRN
jgi:hypothetical protein